MTDFHDYTKTMPGVPLKFRTSRDVRYEGIFSICVAPAGTVESVSVVTSTGHAELDEEWKVVVKRWRYVASCIDGKPIRSCSPVRIDSRAH